MPQRFLDCALLPAMSSVQHGSLTIVASVQFTQALQRHVSAPSDVVDGSTAREVLMAYFARHPGVRGYILDERGVLRRHITVFVNGAQIGDRAAQGDPVADGDEIYVMQALSGG